MPSNCLTPVRRPARLAGAVFPAATLLVLALLGPWTPGARSQSPQRRLDKPVDHFLTLILTPRGFQGPPVRIEEGHILFAVHNRTFIPGITLHIDHVIAGAGGPGVPATIPLGRKRPVWRRTVELKPGKYELAVLENPKWLMPITVVAEGEL